MSSFKSSENIQKQEGGPDRSVSDNQSSSVTLNELAIKARKDTVISSFSKEVILTFVGMLKIGLFFIFCVCVWGGGTPGVAIISSGNMFD